MTDWHHIDDEEPSMGEPVLVRDYYGNVQVAHKLDMTDYGQIWITYDGEEFTEEFPWWCFIPVFDGERDA